MSSSGVREELHSYLRGARETLLWKLEGLREYDARRPLTPTGTNLLGLVKHSTATHLGYFGEVFGRTVEDRAERFSEISGPAAEFWATPDEATADIVRELIDGSVDMLEGADNLHIRDRAEQQRFHDQVEAAAATFE